MKRVLLAHSRRLSTNLVGCGSSGGQIALRNAQQKSVAFSPSLTETTPRVLSLQRDFLRSVPWIKRAYNVQVSESVRIYIVPRTSLGQLAVVSGEGAVLSLTPSPSPRSPCACAGDARAAYRSFPS